MMKKILIASNNDLKIAWFKMALNETGLKILTLNDINYELRCDECGNSYESNAIVKALEHALIFSQYIVVADDGGIIIDSRHAKDMGGLYSHRYPGDFCKDLLRKSQRGNKRDRNCYFEGTCAVAWEENGRICFKTYSTKSHGILKIAQLSPDDIEDNTNVHEIINRVYSDNEVRLSSMPTLLKMESVGVLEPYGRMAYFIKNHILRKKSE